jgi:NADH:ubiquinone oxidoreductase subunit C
MENEISVDKGQLISAVQKMLAEKARFCTASCLDLGDEFEVIYHFEPGESVEPLKHIRVRIAKGDILPSISGIYPCAALAENETQDQFDIKISGLALDFKRRFLRAKGSPRFSLLKPVTQGESEERPGK